MLIIIWYIGRLEGLLDVPRKSWLIYNWYHSFNGTSSFNHQQVPTKEQDNSLELLCVFCPQTSLILQRVNPTTTTTRVQLIVTEQCGKSSLFTHAGHVTEIVPSLDTLFVFGRILKDVLLCLDLMCSGQSGASGWAGQGVI